ADAAEAQVTIARSGYYPELAGTASVSRRSESFPPEENVWSVGVDLSFPFFPGGRSFFDVRGARADEARARANVRRVEEQEALDLESAFVTYADAVENVDVQKQFLAAAEVRAEIARAQYTNGLLSFEDWDLIENDLISAQRAHLQSRRDAEIAAAQWSFARGEAAVR
ncbi:MAG: TolC family protein, partial [Candidatus Binatia bacterium]